MASGNGISNVDIEEFFENKMSDNLKKIFMGVYSSNSITKYINFYEKWVGAHSCDQTCFYF